MIITVMMDDNRLPLLIVDTNVLLSATDTSRHSHTAAVAFLNNSQHNLGITPQIVREYLVVATRPVSVNGLGLSTVDALSNISEISNHVDIFTENRATANKLLDILSRFETLGKQIHDANIVAVALTYGAEAIITDNTADFTKFNSLIEIRPLTYARHRPVA